MEEIGFISCCYKCTWLQLALLHAMLIAMLNQARDWAKAYFFFCWVMSIYAHLCPFRKRGRSHSGILPTQNREGSSVMFPYHIHVG